MEKFTMPKGLQKKITFHSDFCENHTFIKNGEEVIKPIQKMIINGEVVCPRCESEKNERSLQESIQKKYEQNEKYKKFQTLKKKSLLADETIAKATFENYETSIQEEVNNKNLMLEVVDRVKSGQIFNVILQGKQGSGKSHLAYAAVSALNREPNLDKEDLGVSSLFINVEAMIRMIRDSFKNPDSKYTESYFVDLLSKVDYLVLDDIGAETGAIDTEKIATDFVQRILYAVTTTRQGKVTFITTNLGSNSLFNMYDKKLVSRLFKNPKYVIFKETPDKRMANIPF